MNEPSSRAPIAIFAFNRADHLQKTFESLQKCSGFDESPITIFVDGPRNAKDIESVQSVRDYVRGLPFANVTHILRDHNMGLRKSIYEGVGLLTEKYGRAIVLEDDFILSPVVLDYFNEALDKYKDNEHIWSVAAYMYSVPELKHHTEAFVLPFTHPWGWATWHRAWKQFVLDAPVSEDILKSKSFQRRFNMYGLADFTTMLDMALKGKVNSWYIQWYYRMVQMGGVSIFPPQTYVINSGIGDAHATHGSRLNPYHRLVPPAELSKKRIKLPDLVSVDYTAVDAMVNSWDARVQRLVNFLGRIKRMLK